MYFFLIHLKLQISDYDGCGKRTCQPQLAAGQELTGEYINKIFTQRSVWLLPSEELGQLDDLSEDEV